MPRYRRKVVEVDAWQLNSSPDTVPDWITGNVEFIFALDGIYYVGAVVHTLEGNMRANLGDWIVRGVEGEFYPVKPSVFEKIYEKVEDEPQPETDTYTRS